MLVWGSLSLIGWAHGSLGHSSEVLTSFRMKQKLEEDLGGPLLLGDWFAAGEAEIALRAGDLERALCLAEPLAARYREEELFLGLGLAEQVWGLALGRRDLTQVAESDAHLLAALHVLESTEQVMGAAILHLEWADLCRRRGATEQAAMLRAQAVVQFEASGWAHLIEGIERAASLG